MSQAHSVPPPSHQEIARKLSLHSAVKPIVKKPSPAAFPVSGTESDSDSGYPPDAAPTTPVLGAHIVGSSSHQPPLSSIKERRSQSGGEESEEDDDDDDGDWRVGDGSRRERGSLEEAVIKTGYLWKKGERRKTWKKRWFVLRPAHLAFYKTDKEYKLLRLLDLSEIHSCTPVALKKHANTFGLVSPVRTFYLQAEKPHEVQSWVNAINEAREALLTTSTQTSVTSPIPIPVSQSNSRSTHPRLSSSPSQSPYGHGLTSSESEDASPSVPRSYAMSTTPATISEVSSPSKPGVVKDASKVVQSGYLMKCGSRRHNWHKRWFVLSGEKLIYCRSHMDTKPHREIPLSQILDALEYDLPAHRSNPAATSPPAVSPPPQGHGHAHGYGHTTAADEAEAYGQQAGTHTFKVVTTKRTLLLCAPSEEEEIKWLSAVRALIARRSGAGVMPGDVDGIAHASSKQPVAPSGASPGAGPASEGGGTGTSMGAGPGVGTGSIAPASVAGAGGTSVPSAGARRRGDSIVRRLSVSGGAPGGAATTTAAAGSGAGGSSTIAGAGTQEAVSGRQS